jgi:hypothetical protein
VAGQERHLHVDEYHDVPVEDNFSSEEGRAIELQIVMDYNHHIAASVV